MAVQRRIQPSGTGQGSYWAYSYYTGATVYIIAVPSAAQPGDLLVAHGRIMTTSAIPAMPGWNMTVLGTGNNNAKYCYWWRICQAGDASTNPQSPTFNAGAGGDSFIGCTLYTGYDTANPIGWSGLGPTLDRYSALPAVPSVRNGSFLLDTEMSNLDSGYFTAPPGDVMAWAISIGLLAVRSADRNGVPVRSFGVSDFGPQGGAQTMSIVIQPPNNAPTNPGTPSVNPNPVNGVGTISWGASTDADADTVSYVYQISFNGGTSWSGDQIAYQTATSVNRDFTNDPATTNALIRVIAYDGTAWSGWTTSAAFTIQHNRAPNTPTGLTVGVPTANGTVAVSATVSDPDLDNVVARFDVTTDSSYNTGVVSTIGTSVASGSASSATITGLLPGRTYYVRAYGRDPAGLFSGSPTAVQSFVTPPYARVS